MPTIMPLPLDQNSSPPHVSTTSPQAPRRKRPLKQTMSSTFKSLLNSAKHSFTGTSAPTPTPLPELFPKVDPAVDGEDCDHDCDSCHIKYPRGFKIDEEDQLYGFVKGWSTHVLVATGKTDWVRDVADEKGSVMEAIENCGVKPTNGRLMLSASNIPTPTHSTDYSTPTTILLLPAFRIISNVTPASASSLITSIISTSATNTTPLTIPASLPPPTDLPTADALLSSPCPHSALILLCSQHTRDARCGQSAPLLHRELTRHLSPLGLARDLDDSRPGGVGIYFISHVGGHKYSANMMIYRKRNAFGRDHAQEEGTGKERAGHEDEEAAQCIWIARVKPEDCEGIIKHTVLKGKVVKPESQLRGGFDRERGVFSW